MNLADTIASLIKREGAYVDHPNDRGGPTMYGITLAVARAFGYEGAMNVMPRPVAYQIYAERYWYQPGFDKVATLCPDIAEELLDTGVNMGTGTAGKFLQRALNVLNQQGRTFPDLTVDGAIGKMSLYALKTFLEDRGHDGRTVILTMLNALQSCRYIEIAEANPSQEAFSFGWQRTRVSLPQP